MVTFISRTEIEKQPSDGKDAHWTGELYPQMFQHDGKLRFRDNMLCNIGIIWLGHYKLNNRLFPRKKCPICGKEEIMFPYKTVGSILSGCHVIQFYCPNCKEEFVTNDDSEYFRMVYRYILKQREEKKLKSLGGCTSAPANAMFYSSDDKENEHS